LPGFDPVPRDLLHSTLFIVVYDTPFEQVNAATPRVDKDMADRVGEILHSVGR